MTNSIKTGVATSIFKDKNFDSLLTLHYAKEKKIPLVQLYLNKELENTPGAIDVIRETAIKFKIEVLCHSPFYLTSEILKAENHLSFLHQIFPENQKKYVVVHFDERISVLESLKTIAALNTKGFTVCLENYHREKTEQALLHNINSFNLLMDGVARNSYNCIPVLDFPRLFLHPFAPYNPLFLSEMILDSLSRGKGELFLHLIDFTDNKQKPEHWCPIGSGLMPWSRLFFLLHDYNLNISGAILELENEAYATESLKPLEKLMGFQ